MNSPKKDRIDRLAATAGTNGSAASSGATAAGGADSRRTPTDAAPTGTTAAGGTTTTSTATREPTTVADAGRVSGGEGVSLFASAWGRLRRNPLFLIGAAITAGFIVLALLSPWLAPHDPTAQLLYPEIRQQTNPIPAARPGFPLGADWFGRDLLSRLLVGSRQTLFVGVFATLGGLIGGLILGTLAGAFGGWVDALVMRLVDVMLSIPSLLMAFSIAAIFANPSQITVIIAIAIVQIPVFARLLRGSMMAQRHSDHVLAARALGVKRGPIVFRHMLPNALGPVIVQATLVLAVAIIDAAALSFLGLGNPDDRIPEWGQMLGASQQYLAGYPHLAFYPAACIVVVALGFTFMGESLREALDPKTRR